MLPNMLATITPEQMETLAEYLTPDQARAYVLGHGYRDILGSPSGARYVAMPDIVDPVRLAPIHPEAFAKEMHAMEIVCPGCRDDATIYVHVGSLRGGGTCPHCGIKMAIDKVEWEEDEEAHRGE